MTAGALARGAWFLIALAQLACGSSESQGGTGGAAGGGGARSDPAQKQLAYTLAQCASLTPSAAAQLTH